jgi:hypothetical protein
VWFSCVENKIKKLREGRRPGKDQSCLRFMRLRRFPGAEPLPVPQPPVGFAALEDVKVEAESKALADGSPDCSPDEGTEDAP